MALFSTLIFFQTDLQMLEVWRCAARGLPCGPVVFADSALFQTSPGGSLA